MALTENLDDAAGDDEELLAQVAWYYYHDGLTQGDIGQRLGISRIRVSRLLDRGRQTGLIQVHINSAYEGCFRLQRQLIERFGLSDARVVPALEGLPRFERVAHASAQLLIRQLADKELLAIGWGATVMATLRRLSTTNAARSISLVSLTGGVAAYMDGIGLRGHRSHIHLIPTPLRVSSAEFAASLRSEPYVRDILDMALTARLALIGIGAVTQDATLVQNGYCSPSEIELFRRRGAVGDVLGYFYDREGEVLSLSLHDRMVAVAPDRLSQIDQVIGAAAGLEKVQAIRGALRGRLINVLVTDEQTANAVLEED